MLNFHAAVVIASKSFNQDSFRTISITDGIIAIVGRLKSKNSTTIQSYKFDKTKFSVQEAKDWLADHGINVVSFEEAKNIVQAAEVYGLSEDGSEANIHLYGSIGSEDEIDCNEAAAMIHRVPDGVGKINVHINSGGGSIINGLSLFSALMDSPLEVHTFNDGMALSMGGVIMMAGDKIHMKDTAVFMIHEPSIAGETVHTTKDDKIKRGLMAIREQLLSIFVKRTGMDRSELEEMMKDETYLNAIDAKAKGFIDEIVEIEKREPENATGVTSKNNNHSHNYDIDDKGNGRTTKVIPEGSHVHKIDKFVVLPTENHTHKLARAKTGTSRTTLQACIKRVGAEWEIIVINEGLAHTQTGDFYVGNEVLEKSIECFEDVGVYCHSFGKTIDGKFDIRHRPLQIVNPNGMFGNRVGWIDGAKYESVNGKGVIKATFHCVDDTVGNKLVNIWNTDREQMPQFSVDIGYNAKRVGTTEYVESFSEKANSLDMVTVGAFEEAGFDRLVASTTQEEKMKKLLEKLLASFKAGVLKLTGTENKSDDEIMNLIQSALGLNAESNFSDEQIANFEKMESVDAIKSAINEGDEVGDPVPPTDDPNAPADPEPAPEPAPAPDGDNAPVDKGTIAKMMARMASLEADNKKSHIKASSDLVKRMLAEDKTLNDVAKKRIEKTFENRGDVTEDMIRVEMIDWKKDLDRMAASGQVSVSHSIAMGDNFDDTRKKRLELFVNPNLAHDVDEGKNYEGLRPYRTLMDAILDWTPEYRTFEYGKTMKAASRSTFPTLFQDVMNKQIRKQYEVGKQKAKWEKLVQEVDHENLDTQHIYDIGGFPFLDSVGEGDTYQELDNPADVEATYTMAKRGGLFTITEEMMFTAGPKVTQLIRTFPNNMAAAANLTLSLFVFNKITGCDGSSGANTQTIYDGASLYNLRNGVNNWTSNALDYSSFYAGYTVMANQTKLSTSAPAEFKARYLLVPLELLPTAANVTKGEVYPSQTSNGVPLQNPYSALGVEPIGVPNYYLCSDTNNWYLIADKNGFPTLQVGYFQGQRTPQLFLQNTDTVGNVFTNDQWKYKVKFRFGGAITDWRGFYAGLVT